MKLISKTKIHLQTDREGKFEEYILIDVQVSKDTENKKYNFIVRDFTLLNKGEANETIQTMHGRSGAPVYKQYSRTYQEYDQQMVMLSNLYAKNKAMTESEYQDYLMLQAFLYQLEQEPIYNAEFEAY